MELKRYVMNTVTKRIYQFEKQIGTLKDFYRCIDEDLKWAILYAEDLTDCHKTFDNILDLVENMDLIGCKVNNPFINNQVIYMVIDNPLFLSDLVFFLVNGDKVWFRDSQYDDEEKYADIKRNGIEIISIYKRQPNGDYKRYEVK